MSMYATEHSAATSRGLYDPLQERDSCGVGFVARISARPDHSIVESALQVLLNLEHRGAVGGDTATGDGAGILLQIPDAFFRGVCEKLAFDLPSQGDYAVASIFMPTTPDSVARCRAMVARIAQDEGCTPLGWREVPVDASTLGGLARATQPAIWQFFLARGTVPADAFERKVYIIRRRVENEAITLGSGADQFYVASFSSRTIVYKGMLTGSQLHVCFPDLHAPQVASAFAIVHQRYSTNTLPNWRLAQPFRYIAHNGEINTLRGNINRMRAREVQLASPQFGADIQKILPVVMADGSDSAMFDNAFELLVQAGRPAPHAAMMMVPEAWGTKFHMSEDKRAFYEYHSAFMEPWDGPAALVFTDGRYIGATLDRNGLRPARYTITRDGIIVLASETGVVDIPAADVLSHGRLHSGRILLVDLEQQRIVPDNDIKSSITRQRPYRRWVNENRITLRGLLSPADIPHEEPAALLLRQHAFGYTEEELTMVIAPMAAQGQEPIGSMGNDAALAVLSNKPRLLFDYFAQLFAQVTNPPIDPLREELVMSLMGFIGRERNLLDETPAHCRMLKLSHPILTLEDMERICQSRNPDVRAAVVEMLFPAGGDGAALGAALDALFDQAAKATAEGATIIVLSDRAMDRNRAPIPALLATAGLHHYLIEHGLRTATGIIVETGEAREVNHYCLLLGYGANAICPYLALSTARALAENKLLLTSVQPAEAVDLYITAVKKGLLKTFSRMGISTVRSYIGAQIFEAVGVARTVTDKYFCGTASRIGGVGLDEIAAEVHARHRCAYPAHGTPERLLGVGGEYHMRDGGEKHLLSPEAIWKLQHAVRTGDYALFKEYTRCFDDQACARATLRSMFAFKAGMRPPVPFDEVEKVETIVTRFVSSAMSLGSISKETHETLAIAMNRLGGRSNSGEGGEDQARNTPDAQGDKRSRIRQVASARFGVTSEYLVNAEELQIKIAQGAKPGEGGQLPGHKVSEEIARVRHTSPGVTLISPPPHHDIYSIEDLAELIYDLKSANPTARVSVKLVSEAGVGTIAAGVAKAKADMVLISGWDGGTGASPLTAIKHCGLPWELGLAETQQALLANNLRERVRIQVDGQLRTGRDLAIGALLGAEEFGFGTISLVALGCVMMRKCHLNTCPVGIATQDPALRARFTGTPDHVVNFMRFIAQDLREHMAALGFRTLDEMTGQVESLEFIPAPDHPKACALDLSPLLAPPPKETQSRRCTSHQDHQLDHPHRIDRALIEQCGPALDAGTAVQIEMPIRNIHRAVGTTLSREVTLRHGAQGLPADTITIRLTGTAGQSFGAFLSPGITLRLEGAANDYMGKGLSGGTIVVVPPATAEFAPHENVIAGNVCLYGATGGEAYICGIAGERFAVRNSGARAVVEGVGDHGCEYMTGGVVVVLGQTGMNFAAGMSGGLAYVYDETELFGTRCNLDTVDLESVWMEDDKKRLHAMLAHHVERTGSARAKAILDNWQRALPLFVRVIPLEYRAVLERAKTREFSETETLSATEEVYG